MENFDIYCNKYELGKEIRKVDYFNSQLFLKKH